MASAANKEEFFARKMQENNSKPDHLPPSQGGKYVGFGSTPAPRPPSGMHAGGNSVDDVTALLSKGLASLGQVAGVAATTATTVVQSGTQNINHLLQEKQVGQTLQQTSKVVAEKAQVGASKAWEAAATELAVDMLFVYLRFSTVISNTWVAKYALESWVPHVVTNSHRQHRPLQEHTCLSTYTQAPSARLLPEVAMTLLWLVAVAAGWLDGPEEPVRKRCFNSGECSQGLWLQHQPGQQGSSKQLAAAAV
jgi:hypothetical protein